MTETITDDLRDRIEEAEARNVERAANLVPVEAEIEAGTDERLDDDDDDGIAAHAGRIVSDAADKVTTFAKEHPGLAIAGGVVAGLAIASLFKGPRKLAAKGGAKAAGLAAIGGEMALSYALDAYEKAQEAGREGARKLDDLSDNVSDKARKARRETAYRAGNASDSARIAARDTAKAISRKFKG